MRHLIHCGIGSLNRKWRMFLAVNAAVLAISLQPSTSREAPSDTLDDRFARVAEKVPAFGGLYVGPARSVFIVLTDTSPSIVRSARAAITEVFGRDRIANSVLNPVKGQYGFLRLRRMHDNAQPLLSLVGVLFSDIDERTNRLRIGVESAAVREKVEKMLGPLGIPTAAVDIEVTQPMSLDLSVNDKVRPLIGGLQIKRTFNGTCTLSFIAKRDGIRGFVTASHCTDTPGGVEDTVFSQPGSGEAIGQEIADPPFFVSTQGLQCPAGRRCRDSDSAFVELFQGSGASQVLGHRGNIAKAAFGYGDTTIFSGSFPGSYSVAAIDFFPFAGEIATKMGQTTGETWGEITETCVDVNADGDLTFFCEDFVEATSAKGDSGGPVFETVGPSVYDVHLIGILSSGNGAGSSSGTVFAFSTFSNIVSDLGPLDAIKGNDPPAISIVAPANGAKIGYGGFTSVQFAAEISDFEDDCQVQCQVEWSSSLPQDGEMGIGQSLLFEFYTPGKRTITATVTDSGGLKTTDSVTISTEDEPPTVWITKPVAGETLYRGFAYVFEEQSFDSESFTVLPCTSVKWASTKLGDSQMIGGFPKIGCQPVVAFATSGPRTIVLTGTDQEGQAGTDTAAINVVDPPANGPPIATITSPLNNHVVEPDSVVTLKGTLKDPDNKNPIMYQWIIEDGNSQFTVGSGSTASGVQEGATAQWKPATNIPFHCGGSSVDIYLNGTDADGQAGSGHIGVYVLYPVC